VHQLIPLSFLPAGQSAQVGEILGQPEQVHRLHELGLRGGSVIEMVQPGSPCIIRLGGQKLCFRADELMSVLVLAGAST
jgi:Fe2+ transport system protein FeoA